MTRSSLANPSATSDRIGSAESLRLLLVDEFVRAARAVGGLGYVLKPRLVSDLTHAIREARRGRPFVSPR